mmetsp:Transcript_88101/g.278639  ORF Transcript_88101/g.278639 Transcript_88101/m.278639 type:complete len:209 (-) Transcript_88101:58-684(-)
MQAGGDESQPPVRRITPPDLGQSLEDLEIVVGPLRLLVPVLDPSLQDLVRRRGQSESLWQPPVPVLGVFHLLVGCVRRGNPPLAILQCPWCHIALLISAPIPLTNDLVKPVIKPATAWHGPEAVVLQASRASILGAVTNLLQQSTPCRSGPCRGPPRSAAAKSWCGWWPQHRGATGANASTGRTNRRRGRPPPCRPPPRARDSRRCPQ